MKRIVALLSLVLTTQAFGYPAPRGYVTDDAHVLGAEGRVIEHRISEFHKKTTVEIAVLTVETLDGQSVEEYANNVFHQWGIGQKSKNNGVLILVSLAEHKTRIEVGYGLEGQLTDGTCGDIIRQDMVPFFKQRQFGEGINRAITDIEDRLK